MNEFGLVIGETTFGGLKQVREHIAINTILLLSSDHSITSFISYQLDGHGTGAIMDYGSLIWVTLQRARNCDEAITIMDQLVQEYGYASDGESFSIADGNTVCL